MVFKLITVAKFQTVVFDTLGRIGDVWGVCGLLGAHKRLLLCHLGAASCIMGSIVSYTCFCTLANLELLSISAVSFGSLGFLESGYFM